MNLRAKHFLVAAVVITIIGAGGVGCKDEIKEKIKDMVENFFELLDQRADIVCDCYEEMDYDSRVECLQDNQVRESVRLCVSVVMEDNETSAREHIKCLRNVESVYNYCLEDHACGDAEALDACFEYYQEEESTCPQLPEDVGDAADACWTSDP
jgi:hypothetical protein